MKFVSFEHEGKTGIGVVDNSTIAEIAGATGLKQLIGEGSLTVAGANALETQSNRIAIDAARLLPPIPDPDKIVCVGLNYEEHRVETRHAPTTKPTLFTRFANSQCGHEAPLLLPECSREFDYEAELAVVIGKSGRHITRGDALAHIAGYSCYNDGSIRDWQTHTTQFLPGKNFPGTGGFGPYLVTPDEVGDAQNLAIACRLNGKVVQEARTDQMIHSIADQIAYISAFTELVPGDVIVTGTPGGVGFTRNPPLFMADGDTVEVEIEKVGLLRNPVRAA